MGDNFYPEKMFPFEADNFKCFSYFGPTDISEYNNEEFYYGTMSFMHNNIFTLHENSLSYDEEFVSFLEKNKVLFKKYYVEDCIIFTEVYYNSDQCNFELFNSDMLKRINDLKFTISYPISIYHMRKEELIDLLNIS